MFRFIDCGVTNPYVSFPSRDKGHRLGQKWVTPTTSLLFQSFNGRLSPRDKFVEGDSLSPRNPTYEFGGLQEVPVGPLSVPTSRVLRVSVHGADGQTPRRSRTGRVGCRMDLGTPDRDGRGNDEGRVEPRTKDSESVEETVGPDPVEPRLRWSESAVGRVSSRGSGGELCDRVLYLQSL